MQDNYRMQIYESDETTQGIWVHLDNSYSGNCRDCSASTQVWKIYSYADGYLELCRDGILKYYLAGVISPNMEGRIKTYEISTLDERQFIEKSIPWKARLFCEDCDKKTQFTGTSSWRPDSNHYFRGKCDSCFSDRSGGIITLRT